MKMKNLMYFDVKTYKGKNKNHLAPSVINFLNKERVSITSGEKIKYAEMDLTHFINAISVDLKKLERLELEIAHINDVSNQSVA